MLMTWRTPAFRSVHSRLVHLTDPALRWVLGGVLLVHGAARLRIIDIGGPTVGSTAKFMANNGIEPAMLMSIYITGLEFIGGLLLMAGVLTRTASLLVCGFLVVATFFITWPNGFLVRGGPNGSGFEYSLVLLVLAGTTLIKGDDDYSMSKIVRGYFKNHRQAQV